jgi:ABC-type transporter Mla MlaB component
MQMYLNDSVKSFEFVLHGELTGDAVQSLEQAWTTATSILNGKELRVDVSALTTADAGGIELLCRMTGSGARLRAPWPPQSEEFLRSLGVPVVAPPRRSGWPWIWGVRRLFGFSV